LSRIFLLNLICYFRFESTANLCTERKTERERDKKTKRERQIDTERERENSLFQRENISLKFDEKKRKFEMFYYKQCYEL
jgi:predicted nucleotidyltransferase